MKRHSLLSEKDLNRLVKRVLLENPTQPSQTTQGTQQSDQVQYSKDFDNLMNFLYANGMVRDLGRHRLGGNNIQIGNPKDQTNYLADLIGKLTNNRFSDSVLAWANQKFPGKNYQHAKISNEQYSKQYRTMSGTYNQ
jgi:hypothetical protein